jgi:hypothetical protein
MGTKGYVGFYHNGKFYLVFIKYDTYIEGLGFILLKELKELNLSADELKEKFESLIIVDAKDEIVPNETEINDLINYCHEPCEFMESEEKNFVWLLNKIHGSYKLIFESGHFVNDIKNNALFEESKTLTYIEYMYILDVNNYRFNICSQNVLIKSYKVDNLPTEDELFDDFEYNNKFNELIDYPKYSPFND